MTGIDHSLNQWVGRHLRIGLRGVRTISDDGYRTRNGTWPRGKEKLRRRIF